MIGFEERAYLVARDAGWWTRRSVSLIASACLHHQHTAGLTWRRGRAVLVVQHGTDDAILTDHASWTRRWACLSACWTCACRPRWSCITPLLPHAVRTYAGHACTVLTCAGREGRAARAFSLYNDMKKRGTTPDDVTHISLLNAFAEAKPVQRARAEKVGCHITSHETHTWTAVPGPQLGRLGQYADSPLQCLFESAGAWGAAP